MNAEEFDTALAKGEPVEIVVNPKHWKALDVYAYYDGPTCFTAHNDDGEVLLFRLADEHESGFRTFEADIYADVDRTYPPPLVVEESEIDFSEARH